MDYQALRTLIDSEPLNAGRTDQEVMDWCNDPTVARDRTHYPDYEMMQVIMTDTTEYAGYTAAERDAINLILAMSEDKMVPVTIGTPERDALQQILGTNTKAELASRLPETVSPAVNADLGVVNLGDVQNARAL